MIAQSDEAMPPSLSDGAHHPRSGRTVSEAVERLHRQIRQPVSDPSNPKHPKLTHPLRLADAISSHAFATERIRAADTTARSPKALGLDAR
ncbi:MULTISPECIES: hypothetical protein [Bradyrhizobium]|uniref:hypothetical protein n=1 Tax=Bradyrhizobium centrosematis TaxID=1300039 RepID=UPI0021683FBE|nr:hypothetical protein [Bradyrhizobium centrosematis]MCS3765709.1 hypothetical protein [Bradyrhizobium centrosematis]MCS3777935.1 hypothetical protein [Bradyrhizobium centrosematis]